jgi:hypothetical protein
MQPPHPHSCNLGLWQCNTNTVGVYLPRKLYFVAAKEELLHWGYPSFFNEFLMIAILTRGLLRSVFSLKKIGNNMPNRGAAPQPIWGLSANILEV